MFTQCVTFYLHVQKRLDQLLIIIFSSFKLLVENWHVTVLFISQCGDVVIKVVLLDKKQRSRDSVQSNLHCRSHATSTSLQQLC